MKITYFYRNHKAGYSIKKVSDLYVNQMEDKEVFEMPSQYASIKSILRNRWYTFKHRNKRGINHITGDIHYCIIPLMFCKTVLTIHDACVYDNSKGLKKLIMKLFWFKIPLLLATRVVCISENTKKSIARFTNRKDVQVIYNAIDPNFNYSPIEFKKHCPNILLIGTSWNKNVERTMIALKNINCKVTIIGKLTMPQMKAIQECNISLTNLADLTDAEIIQEYNKADIISFCSEYEGFGMPIIEANATGRAVITSNLPPMTEIGGKAAYYVNPFNVDNIRQNIIKIINDDKTRNEHIVLGLENTKRFSLSNIVAQYKELYNSIV